MASNVIISGNTVKVKSSGSVLKIVTIVSLCFGGLGVYLLTINPVSGHFLIGFGIAGSAIGAHFWFNSYYYKLMINETPGMISIIESRITGIETVNIPLNYYTAIVLQMNINTSKGASSGQELHLVSASGSSLHIADFNDPVKASEAAAKLQQILGLDLYSDMLTALQVPKTSVNFTASLPPKSSIRKSASAGATTITWGGKFFIIDTLTLPVIIYGFFHMFHFTSDQWSDNILAYIAVYGILSVMVLIFSLIIISNLIGKTSLTFKGNTVLKSFDIFGRQTLKKSLSRDDIAVIQNSLKQGGAPLTIITREGLDLMRGLTESFKKNETPGLAALSAFMTIKDEIIILDTGSLTLSEKLYIESVIYMGGVR